ncbi:hypothetical protein J2TS6_39780 [Paenibacillus albilobatus]|uniref:Gram-positive cocci surface proteins LPxTG domain-containing protein n=1 Tax=Paenibacillus albilobatus TaxID=2716884 RepID=A0A919XHC0_9BACL|nr:hypothetical protein J2TS6_39780 [Paenibacillus albilobatus]
MAYVSVEPEQAGTSVDSANVESGNSEGKGGKLPDTATNMYNYMLAGCIIFLVQLFLVRRKKV